MEVLEKTYFEKHADAILAEHKLTKATFAQQLGILPQNVRKWFQTTDVRNLQKIANVLNVSLGYLINGDVEEANDVRGYLEYKGVVKKINSIEDVDAILSMIKFEKKQ